MSNLVLLSYVPSAVENDEKKLIAYINGSKFVKEWHHPFVGMFIIASDSNPHELGDGIDDFMCQVTASYFLVDISESMFGGRLPDPSWDWVSARSELKDKIKLEDKRET